uniref:Peptidase S1 domain-containing protein n=1 Tax=Leptobrachium leishanense TaxID=445787 RepID=A0A8C5WF19_9ANUR
MQSPSGSRGLQALDVCGRPVISDRIVGGKDARKGKWPWQVLLQFKKLPVCGGSLLSESWVMTAAHCFESSDDVSLYRVFLGAHQLSHLDDANVVSMQVKRIITHPDFLYEGSSGDIALVELEKPVQYSSYILPICLPSQGIAFAAGTTCWATGWGKIKDRVPLGNPQTLQEVELALMDRNACESMYQSSMGYRPVLHLIQDDMICAGYKEGQKDACQGDSGGPLVCNVHNAWLQVGVITWGVGCAKPNCPGVYSRVQTYNDWIQSHVPSIRFSDGGQVLPQGIHPNSTETQTVVNSKSMSLNSTQDGRHSSVNSTETKMEMLRSGAGWLTLSMLGLAALLIHLL